MADTEMKSGVGTPPYVVYILLRQLYGLEKFTTREQLLDAYAECLDAAIGARTYQKK